AALVAGLNGGTEVTSVNITPPPSNVTTSVQVNSSGFLYSRVTQTFNTTVTIKNTHAAPISSPIHLSCGNLPAGVSFTNATGSYVGTPFITALKSGSLAPGQSISVALAFKNSSTSAITFAPVVYSGPINF